MSIAYVLIFAIMFMCIATAIVAAIAFVTLGWGRIGVHICIGLVLTAISWSVFASVLELHYNELVNVGLSIKLVGICIMCRGFQLLYKAGKGSW